MPNQEKRKLGVLNLHGFTSSLDCVSGLNPTLDKLALPYRMPVLRGHMQTPEALVGVRWQDWVTDAEAALCDLLTEVEKVVVVGLSMGGLVALQLAMEHADQVDAVVTVAAALRFNNSLAPGRVMSPLRPLVARLVKWWPMPIRRADPALLPLDNNYRRAPMDAIASLLEYSAVIERRLAEVKAPILILETHADQTVDPRSAQIIYDRVSSVEKRIVWFDVSTHEMMRDCEAPAVFAQIEAFLRERIAATA
jgi:carboxylesterase